MQYLRNTIFILCAFFLFVCPLKAEIIGTSDDEVKAIAEPILEGVLLGFKHMNYEVYSENFDDSLKEKISQEKFILSYDKIQESFGNCLKKRYLTFFNKKKFTAVIWKAQFESTENDVLIKLILTKEGEKYLVSGLWFQ